MAVQVTQRGTVGGKVNRESDRTQAQKETAMTTQKVQANDYISEETADILNALIAEDALQGMSTGEVAEAVGDKTFTQLTRMAVNRAGYREVSRSILQFNADGTPKMTQRRATRNGRRQAIFNEDGTPEMVQATRSIRFLAEIGREAEVDPVNNAAGNATTTKGKAVLTDDIRAKVAGMSLEGMLANDLEDRIGETLSVPVLRRIAAEANLKLGFTTIRHADYKAFKSLVS